MTFDDLKPKIAIRIYSRFEEFVNYIPNILNSTHLIMSFEPGVFSHGYVTYKTAKGNVDHLHRFYINTWTNRTFIYMPNGDFLDHNYPTPQLREIGIVKIEKIDASQLTLQFLCETKYDYLETMNEIFDHIRHDYELVNPDAGIVDPAVIEGNIGSASKTQNVNHPISDQILAKRDNQEKRNIESWHLDRAYLFKSIKDLHPGYTYNSVASDATDVVLERIERQIREENPSFDARKIISLVNEKFQSDYHNYKGSFSDEDVRNDYKKMGWKWLDPRKIPPVVI